MFKANSYFFLAEVKDHIRATFSKFDGAVLITFAHQHDRHLDDKLMVEVQPVPGGYLVEWKIEHRNNVTHEGKSEVIPATEIYGVVTAIANETIQPIRGQQ